MQDNEKKPALRFKGFTDPWEQRKLGEIASFSKGSGYSKADIRESGIPLFLYGRMYTQYETRVDSVDTFAAPRPGTLYSKGTEIVVPASGESAEDIARASAITREGIALGGDLNVVYPQRMVTPLFLAYGLSHGSSQELLAQKAQGKTVVHIHASDLKGLGIAFPDVTEQQAIGTFFSSLDDLITLHQRKRESRIIRVRSFIWLAGDISGIGVSAYQPEREDRMTEGNTNAETLFCDYYEQWISVYKEGAIREVTMKKYRLTQAWLGRLIPDLKLADMDRVNYQKLINGYAEHHERQTTMDFHHQLKGAILDAVDEGLIQRDPTRKAIIKGKPPCSKKTKYLNQFELHAVLADLELGKGPSWDWLILLVAKTGLRFSEALGLTPDDFDFVHQTLSVSKTWDYKNGGGFVPTKNASSVRKVQLDWQLIMQLSTLLKDMPASDPIFVNGKVYNSTANNILARHCERANVPVISIHGLRHTHASLLLFAGVSIASVSKRLGHASMNTTQDTYLHVIRELENKDVDIVMRALSTLI